MKPDTRTAVELAADLIDSIYQHHATTTCVSDALKDRADRALARLDEIRNPNPQTFNPW